MSDKSLKDKAIKIQGKDYVLVADRIVYFNELYKEGAITTKLVSPVESDIIVVKAEVFPDGLLGRRFTGYSQAVKGAGFINKTAALENAETSAVGRALAMMGIGVIDSVASIDEINKAEGTDPEVVESKGKLLKAFRDKGIDEFNDQIAFISKTIGKETIDTTGDALKVIKALNE